MRVELVLEAVDRASRAIAAVEGGLGRLAQAQERIADATNRARTDFFDKLAGAGAAIAPLVKANQVFAEFEDKLTDVGLKGELAGAKLRAFGAEMITLAPKVNRTATELLEGVDKLVEGGMKFDVARQLVQPLAKTSVATKATMEDLSKTTVTLVNNLKVSAAEVPRALDVMAQTGKDGQFELKAMSQYFPRLGAQYAAMGQTGVKATADLAAALQVIRGQTGRDETAVVALEDLLNKITLGPAKKKFEEVGIDIADVMDKAKKAGTVFETMFDVLKKATGGDAGKLSDFFSDKQALAAARALQQEYEKFLEIRKKALGATGVVDQDFLTRMGLQIEGMKRLSNATNAFWLALGTAIAPALSAIVTRLATALEWLTGVVQAYPQATAWIVGFAAAIMGIGAVIAAFKLGALIFGSTLVMIARGLLMILGPGRMVLSFLWGIGSGIAAGVAAFGGWGAVAAAIGARLMSLGSIFSWLVGPIMMLARATMAFGAALMATPVGWIIAGLIAVAAAAYLIYRNWDQIGPWLANMWATIQSGLANAWAGVKQWFTDLGQSITGGLSSAWESVKAWFGVLKWPELPKFEFLDSLSSAFEGVLKRLTDGWEKVKGFFSGIRLPEMPNISGWFGGAGTPSAPAVAASAEQAQAAKAAIDAIAPAASTAVSQATSIFSGISFHSQGMAMMETLASGMRAGAAAAVAAARATVQQIRDHLPHSPARIGPLSDLDRVQFGQTLATAISAGAPAAIGAARAMAFGLAATIPTMGTPAMGASGLSVTPSSGATAGGAGGGITISVSYAPTIQGGSATDVMEQLRQHSHELVQMIRAEVERQDRTRH